MPYSKQVFLKVKAEYDLKRERAVALAEARRAELHAAFPELAEIDRRLSNTGLGLFAIASRGGEDLQQNIEQYRADNLSLQKLRGDMLTLKGYPRDYTQPRYECSECGDSGYVGIDMCGCMKKSLARESYLASGLGELSRGQTFESFDLSLYSDVLAPGSRAVKTPRTMMSAVLDYCLYFADSFERVQGMNLMLIGHTGVGKTHLTSAIAHRVIDKGFDVVYDTAQSILYAFERERFNRSVTDEPTQRYLECDLLILDDLGTEYSGAMSGQSLFAIINNRTLAGKSTLISTNLRPEELQKRYDARLQSRLFGEFRILSCCDEDIRLKKNNFV